MPKVIEKRADGSIRVKQVYEKKSRTEQHHAKSVNINTIMARYKKGVMPTHLNRKTGVYGDFTNVPSYQEALQTVINANDAFSKLPAAIRAEFKNDPEVLINFLKSKDPKDVQRSIELGLRVKREVKPQVDPVVEAINKTTEAVSKLKMKTKVVEVDDER